MENESVASLRKYSEAELDRFITNALSYNVDEDDLRTVIAELCNTNLKYPIPLPITGICYNYLKGFFKINYSNIVWKSLANLPISTTGTFIRWTYNNETHCVLLGEEQYEDFMSTTPILEFQNLSNEGIADIKLCEDNLSKFEKPARKYVKWYLHHIRVREKDSETFEDYIEEEVDVTPNDEILDIKGNTARFSGALWADKIQEKTIILAGLGGIGSYVAFLLSRMQPKQLFLYDDDVVESVNMSGQLYGTNDIDTLKVTATALRLSNLSMYNSVFALPIKFTEDCETSDIMICGFDNMEARKTFFNSWVKHITNIPEEDRGRCLFIDGRLAAEALQVFCIRGDDHYCINRYREKYLFDDKDADATVCSYKQTTYMANMIGSIMVNLFTNFVANEIVPNMRALPFFVEYEAATMHIKFMES